MTTIIKTKNSSAPLGPYAGGTLTPPMTFAASGIANMTSNLPPSFYAQSGINVPLYRVSSEDDLMWPFSYNASSADREFIKDFKTRHPDFETFGDEIRLILKHKPGLANTVLFLSLIYEMAKKLRNVIETETKEDTVEELLDGTTTQNPGPR